MIDKSWEQKRAHLDKVFSLARERLKGDMAKNFPPFVDRLYANAAPPDILERTPEGLYGAAVTLWKFIQRRQPRQAKVMVFNPSTEEHGWQSSHTVIAALNDDMPFLVDSTTAALAYLGREIHLLVHPTIPVSRDGDGKLQAIAEQSEDGSALTESLMYIEIDEQTATEAIEKIQKHLERVLADVRAAVEDWRAMHEKMNAAVDALEKHPPEVDREELDEIVRFLRWLGEDNYTFLGYREYDFTGASGDEDMKIVEGTGLGTLRNADVHILRGATGLGASSPEVRHFLQRPDPIIITKANVRATVHRPIHMDYIGIKKFDEDGALCGEHRFVGLFTSPVYARSIDEIPLLRRKVLHTIDRAGFAPGSHDAKALRNVLENFPRNEVFQMDDDTLYHHSLGIMRLQERPRAKVFLRHDQFERFVSALVYLPREIYNTDLRIKIQTILAEAFHGSISTIYTQVQDAPLARIHIIVKTTPGAVPEVDEQEIDRKITDASRTWADNLRDALIARWGEEKGNHFAYLYGDAFSLSYRETFPPDLALFDIEKLEELHEHGPVTFNTYRLIEDSEIAIRLKIYHANQLIPLSDCLPKLEHMGLKVIDHQAHSVTLNDGDRPGWVHDFCMVDATGAEISFGGLKARFEELCVRVWAGDIEDDGFNALVLRAGLDWRQAMILRAYGKYLRQTGMTYSQTYMHTTLAANPEITRRLVRLFEIYFDPADFVGLTGADGRAQEVLSQIEAKLGEVASFDEDRILKAFLSLIRATLRTNYYQSRAGGGHKPYLSFKLNSQEINELPQPRPMVEIFVYSPRFEGVHLRGGKVARGGIRWSDRREDFRNEVLGLMKAQMVKNAVIVPVGAKGGFVPKQLPDTGSREDIMQEAIACYQDFIRGLLDLTDNLAGGEIKPPAEVVRRDEDDPYLVVAADKGTASFSDIANAISAEYDFWLDDAFASGGSAGYDHKKMGITARGAWVSVQRHFREMGIDVQTTPFSVIGVGDMSGDVFGNGMLLSRCIRLLGAFDHRHVFIDPDPDPQTSFAERQRLFALPRSSWADYNTDLISKGGGVFARTAKLISLTPQIKKLLGVSQASLTPTQLIQALLRAEADLLWIGGIGTYVKAHHESNADVGDRANDALRINGRDLRVKVVGEGGNLGFTQAGRIEFARHGGRLNTDAIDNSAGVDCSDHEVNIKILLNAVVDNGNMTRKQRDTLLRKMTDEVAGIVLQDNYLQTQALSVAEAKAATTLEVQGQFMRALAAAGKLDRDLEYLPGDDELAERAAEHQGLTRPELSVLIAYAKMTLYEQLLAGKVPDDAYLERDLMAAFPAPLRKKYKTQLRHHRLRREIIATELANSVVNRAGPTFVYRIEEETDATPDDILRAFVVTREVFDLPALWDDIAALDNKTPTAIQYLMLIEIVELLRRQIQWFLKNCSHPIDISAAIADHAPGIATLRADPKAVFAEFDRGATDKQAAMFTEQGVPENLALALASLEPLAYACDIVLVANALDRPVVEAGRAYFALGHMLGLDWLRAAAEDISTTDHWDRLAVSATVDDLFSHQRILTQTALEEADGADSQAAIENWVARQDKIISHSRHLIADFKASGPMTVTKLGFAARQFRKLLPE
jgi:glutamate dehydrogenase